MWCAKSIVRKLTSTVDVSPFFVANCCFVVEKNSCITDFSSKSVEHVLQNGITKINVLILGSLEANDTLNVS